MMADKNAWLQEVWFQRRVLANKSLCFRMTGLNKKADNIDKTGLFCYAEKS